MWGTTVSAKDDIILTVASQYLLTSGGIRSSTVCTLKLHSQSCFLSSKSRVVYTLSPLGPIYSATQHNKCWRPGRTGLAVGWVIGNDVISLELRRKWHCGKQRSSRVPQKHQCVTLSLLSYSLHETDRISQGLWMYNVSRKKADLLPFSGYDELERVCFLEHWAWWLAE